MSTSNQPQHLPTDKSPYKLSARGNVAQASSQVNRMARRDPALYPLAFCIVGAFAITGYFGMTNLANPDPATRLHSKGMVKPWDDPSKHDTGGAVASFKYRYQTRDGHMEDGYPTMNQDVRKVKDDTPHKYHT
ncbi:hypothetical protein Q8F55_001268 [Vanrija albida]|uniref:Uncharacterized protein n=1 Tax=Vanrija albida TaxID=181172 RepID=A0ABR3QFJ2_9TREE